MNMIYEYINYLIKSKKRHGIHSPFVYDFTDKCLKIKVDKTTKSNYKKLTKQLINNTSKITLKDHGAGSKSSKSKSISSIYQKASTKGKYAELLYKISAHYLPKYTLELGTNLGIGTYFLSQGNPFGYVTTIEGDPSLFSIAQQNTKHYGSNSDHHHSTFQHYLAHCTTVFDFIFIDGDHRGAKLLQYLECLHKNMHDSTIILIDDIRWSEDMFNAWKKIIKMDHYHLTMDLFKFGIILKKHTKEKEHFTIRY
jgi:predicted O-methyltransferase YrrM